MARHARQAKEFYEAVLAASTHSGAACSSAAPCSTCTRVADPRGNARARPSHSRMMCGDERYHVHWEARGVTGGEHIPLRALGRWGKHADLRLDGARTGSLEPGSSAVSRRALDWPVTSRRRTDSRAAGPPPRSVAAPASLAGPLVTTSVPTGLVIRDWIRRLTWLVLRNWAVDFFPLSPSAGGYCHHPGADFDRCRPLTWSPLTESNRRPSPYHGHRGAS